MKQTLNVDVWGQMPRVLRIGEGGNRSKAASAYSQGICPIGHGFIGFGAGGKCEGKPHVQRKQFHTGLEFDVCHAQSEKTSSAV